MRAEGIEPQTHSFDASNYPKIANINANLTTFSKSIIKI